jgi:hypothetical protein
MGRRRRRTTHVDGDMYLQFAARTTRWRRRRRRTALTYSKCASALRAHGDGARLRLYPRVGGVDGSLATAATTHGDREGVSYLPVGGMVWKTPWRRRRLQREETQGREVGEHRGERLGMEDRACTF